MLHDPNLAASAVHPLSCVCAGCGPITEAAPAPVQLPVSLGTRLCITVAAIAFFLVPGRFILVWIAPAAAQSLGFGR